jgi:hypothetical protein
MILQAKYYSAQSKFTQAQAIYDQIGDFIKKNELLFLQNKLDEELEEFNTKIIHLKDTIEQNRSVIDNLQKLELLEYLDQIKDAL